MQAGTGKRLMKRKNDTSKITILIIVIITVGIIISLVLQFILKMLAMTSYMNGDVDSTWLSALPSYWGGIIGGIISGSLACLGVIFTIRYYKESDIKKERDAVRPFLRAGNMIVSGSGKAVVGAINLGPGKAQDRTKEVKLTISNIGNGFAYTLRLYNDFDEEGMAFKRIYTVGGSDQVRFAFDIKQFDVGVKIPISIKYLDSKGNEYMQTFEFYRRDAKSIGLRVDTGYPQFTGVTHQNIEDIEEGEINSE